ncbi:MAG: nucleotidyltransferase family protein [Clostridia bacterium]|nr:nucleotidyltransferase family protein [Clostridia bacterium]
MSYETEYLMYLTRCGACGETPVPPSRETDWQNLLRLAYEQDVSVTAAMALKQGTTGCPDALLQPLVSQMRGSAVQNVRRAEGWLALLAKAEEQGIELLVIKGYDVARFYRNPECRVANDMDLLVRPQHEQEAMRFLEDNGFRMEERKADSNHAVGEHPLLGMVELHISLISQRFCMMFAAWQLNESAFDNVQYIAFSGGSFRAMESTNALLFLTFHLIKHFLYNGISLKMLWDIALFAKNTLQSLDTARYRQLLQSSRYEYFMRVVFGVMVKYGGFEREDFPLEPIENEADMEALLQNMFESGAMGKNQAIDEQSAWMFYYYDFARSENSREDLALINEAKREDIRGGLFPSAVILSRRYPILLRAKWLYPFCWLHRLLTRGFAFLFSRKRLSRRKIREKEELSLQAQEKIQLLQQFQIAEKYK